MLSMVHSQINRAINTALSERVIPEIQNIVSSMSSSGNRDTEASMSPCSQENRENPSGLKSKITKKDSRSVGDLRDTAASGHYIRLNGIFNVVFFLSLFSERFVVALLPFQIIDLFQKLSQRKATKIFQIKKKFIDTARRKDHKDHRCLVLSSLRP